MSKSKLKYFSLSVLDGLYSGIFENLHRYKTSDFSDLIDSDNWNIESSVEVDLEQLSNLVPETGQEFEVENSLLVWKSLHNIDLP